MSPVPLIQLRWLQRWTALLALVLIGATWPLWLGTSDFPLIPICRWLCGVPVWVDWIALAGLLAALSAILFGGPRARRWGWPLVLVCGLVLLFLNQHRLQPWFYQLLFFAAIFRLSSAERSWRLLTWIVISIYFYSAVGKFDFEFLHTVGQQFWRGMLALIRRQPAPAVEAPIVWIALLPLAELLLALGLAWRATRALAGVLAIAFHAMLMVLLGPLGLGHSWGVFFWNLQFAGQALLLFVWPAIRNDGQALADLEQPQLGNATKTAGNRRVWGDRLATALAALVVLLPLLERFGGWDHWTSWALYAPHSSRVEVWLASTSIDKLPDSLRCLLPDDAREGLWIRLPLERWSLAETGAPIYPQARFQLGVAQAIAERVDMEFHIRAIVQSAAARWDGRRTSRELEGTAAIDRAGPATHALNTRPR